MKKLLAIIDYQNDFVTGSLAFPAAEEIDTGIATRAQAYLAQGDHVLFTLDTHQSDYLNTREGICLPIPHCLKRTKGWQLYGKTQELCRETCANSQIHTISKQAFGISPESSLALRASLGELSEIQLVGLVTNMCVISNAVIFQSIWPNTQVIVDASLCRSFDPILHEKALDVMEGLQIKVIGRHHFK